jgi:hypothetical protein
LQSGEPESDRAADSRPGLASHATKHAIFCINCGQRGNPAETVMNLKHKYRDSTRSRWPFPAGNKRAAMRSSDRLALPAVFAICAFKKTTWRPSIMEPMVKQLKIASH